LEETEGSLEETDRCSLTQRQVRQFVILS